VNIKVIDERLARMHVDVIKVEGAAQQAVRQESDILGRDSALMFLLIDYEPGSKSAGRTAELMQDPEIDASLNVCHSCHVLAFGRSGSHGSIRRQVLLVAQIIGWHVVECHKTAADSPCSIAGR
jgi:hypothetical protein